MSPTPRPIFNRNLLGLAAVITLAAAALTAFVAGHPVIPEDVTLERDVQAAQRGPLAYAFPFFSWIGDFKGMVLEAIIFVAVLILNRRAWLVAVAAATTSLWYTLLSHVIVRRDPRPPRCSRSPSTPAHRTTPAATRSSSSPWSRS